MAKMKKYTGNHRGILSYEALRDDNEVKEFISAYGEELKQALKRPRNYKLIKNV